MELWVTKSYTDYMQFIPKCISSREHEGTERDTEGVGCDMS